MERQLIHTVVDPTVRHDNHLPRCCMRMAGGLHPRDRWSCPPWLIAGGNTPAQSPLSGRGEQARTEGLAPPPGPGNASALRPSPPRVAPYLLIGKKTSTRNNSIGHSALFATFLGVLGQHGCPFTTRMSHWIARALGSTNKARKIVFFGSSACETPTPFTQTTFP